MTDETVKIEKNIPMPRRGRELPFEEMEIGDSFQIPDGLKPEYARTMVTQAQKRLSRKFSLRRFGDRYRCWRTA